MVAFNAVAALSLCVSAASLSLVAAHPHESRTRSAPLPGRWYQDEDHPVHALFRRQPVNGKRQSSPAVGSSAWTAQYPQGSPDPNQLPQEWLDALNQAVNDGRIPSYPPSTSQNGNAPTYPAGINENRNNATICAATDRECRIPQDIWDGPDGYMGLGFDDGPLPASPRLYDFLDQNNLTATHYFIGLNILSHPDIFLQAYDMGGDLAVHTWTHPQMTTMSNNQVVGQLGWTIQIIYDSTDGKVPRFWRPPYGDIDTRVSAIAREVFGMTAIMWNQDTEDWTMASNPPGTTVDQIQSNMQKWLSGPKSPGLIILEHELTNDTVQAFMNAYPLVGQNGWKTDSQARLNDSMSVYQDGQENDVPFNSLITPSSSASATPSSGGNTSASGTHAFASASASSSSSSLSAESSSHTSGSTAVLVFPSLVSLGMFVGGLLALL